MPSPPQIPIPERIRNLRGARKLTAYRLAEMTGISPSYLSLIESGQKVPSEEIAVRLAQALGDPPELYRAWVEATRQEEIGPTLFQASRLTEAVRDPALRAQLSSGAPLAVEGTLRQPAGQHLRRASLRRGWRLRDLLAKSDVHEDEAPEARPIEVPLFADGADPYDAVGATAIREVLEIDRRLLPAGTQGAFAYRPSAATLARVTAAIREGDLVLLAPPPPGLDPRAIYAVRSQGRVVLTRVLVHGRTLVLLPSDEGGEPVLVEGDDDEEVRSHLVGVVVATVRTWPGGGRPDPGRSVAAPGDTPPGRSARIEGAALVRDCEWRDRYGWRPVQRPEDLDWVEAQPGRTIRFNLIRDGRRRWVLEMSGEQWRQALGSYVHAGKWRENGYVVAITHMVDGVYAEEFQPRWAGYVREA